MTEALTDFLSLKVTSNLLFFLFHIEHDVIYILDIINGETFEGYNEDFPTGTCDLG